MTPPNARVNPSRTDGGHPSKTMLLEAAFPYMKIWVGKAGLPTLNVRSFWRQAGLPAFYVDDPTCLPPFYMGNPTCLLIFLEAYAASSRGVKGEGHV